MANVDRPNGFTPVSKLDGSEVPVWRFPLLSTHARIGIGDLVESEAGGGVELHDTAGTNVAQIVGAVVAVYDTNEVPCGAVNSTTSNKYSAASVAGYADVALMTDDAVFRAQSSGSLASTAVFASADCVAGSCSTVTGRSIMEMGTATTGAANFIIIGKVDDPSNAWGTNVEVLVTPCEGMWGAARAGV